ncbi:MAG: extracellular solute-binding protein [Oscillospiraceae bacterium]|nr:extracellular solute-binding protein [Oscillospiraceae bacterium]
MKKTKFLALLLALVMVVGIVAACDSSGTPDQPATTPPPADTSGGGNETTGGGEEVVNVPVDREFYEFDYYMNYDWYGVREWGSDVISRHWGEKFNIQANISKPDANPDDLLTLMMTTEDFPNAIWMERGIWNARLARAGHFVDLDTLKPLVDNNWYDESILPLTQHHLSIDGTLYAIPNWARKDVSGGNNAWMYTQSIYEAAGSPTIETWDDLYNYAIAVRDNVPTNNDMDVIPVSSESGWINGENLVNLGIYRSFGGVNVDAGWWGVLDGEYKPLFYDPVYQDALVEANKWFREGLISPTMLSDTLDQFLEKVVNARVGLIFYDHSQDDGRNFRKTLRATFPGDSIEVIKFEGDGLTRLYPPANGLAPGRIYAEHYGTMGWNVTCIFNNSEKPERIFEFMSYLLTKEGSIEMMYGPQGGSFWSELDDRSNPILTMNPDDNPDTVNEYALWHWTVAGHADNVDHTKFAVNAAVPAEWKSWVVTHQAEVFTPLMAPLTDEYANVQFVITGEPETPLAIAHQLCVEFVREKYPQIIQAPSEDAARAIIQEIIDFLEANNVDEMISAFAPKYDDNCNRQGGSIFTR